MSQTDNPQRMYARTAAIAWLLVPTAWGLSALFGGDGPDWGGAAQAFYMIGAMVLLGAGVFTLLAFQREASAPARPAGFKFGLALGVLAVAASFVSWAIVLWMVPYAAAMIVVAATHPGLRQPASLFGGGMVAGVAAFAALTAWQVGRPDEYGDYPIAFVSGILLATIGAAIGMYLLSRRQADAVAPAEFETV